MLPSFHSTFTKATRICSLTVLLTKFGILFRHKEYIRENINNSSKTDDRRDKRKYQYDVIKFPNQIPVSMRASYDKYCKG